MSNFTANIKAILDTDKISEQISDLQNNINKTGALKLKVELTNDSFDIKGLNSSLSKNFSNAGANAGQSFSKSLSSSLNKIHLVNGSIGNVKNMLQGAGFDKKSINSITQDLDKMILTVKEINTEQLRNGDVKIKISGVDELGRSVKIIRAFDKETGNVIYTTKSFSQSFSKIVKGISESTKNTLSNIKLKIETGDFQSKIDRVKTSLSSLSNGSESASKNISLLETALKTMNSSTATPEEKIQAYRDFNSILSTTRIQLSEAQKAERQFNQNAKESAKATETLTKRLQKEVDTATGAINSGSVEADFNKIKTQFDSLGTKSEKLENNFRDLKVAFSTMNSDNASIDQKTVAYQKFSDLLPVIRKQISAINAEERNKPDVESITKAINSGSVEASIAMANRQYRDLDVAISKLGSGESTNNFRLKLDGIKTDLSELKILQDKMGSGIAGDELVSTYEKLNEILIRVKNNLSTVASDSKQIPKMASTLDASKLSNEMQIWLQKNQRAAKDFGGAITGLDDKLKMLSSTGQLTESELKDIRNEFIRIKSEATAAGKVGKTFGSTIKNAFQSITKYVGVSTVIYKTIEAFKEMFNNVVEIDSAMTELKKVTNETSDTYEKFLSRSASVAKGIGTTTAGIINSTADFARLGYDFDESQELAKVANIYAVVGDEIDSVDTATKSIVSTLAAYKDEITDTMQIVDKFNEVSNNFAISSGGIGDALQRSASSLAAAGNSLDQSIALIAAANTVVQDPDAVGKQMMPTIKITISVKSQRWSRPRKDFVDIVTHQLGRVCFFIL